MGGNPEHQLKLLKGCDEEAGQQRCEVVADEAAAYSDSSVRIAIPSPGAVTSVPPLRRVTTRSVSLPITQTPWTPSGAAAQAVAQDAQPVASSLTPLPAATSLTPFNPFVSQSEDLKAAQPAPAVGSTGPVPTTSSLETQPAPQSFGLFGMR